MTSLFNAQYLLIVVFIYRFNNVTCVNVTGASKQMAMVIEGEALLNDGAAIVFFNVFLKLITSEINISGRLGFDIL